MPSAVGRYRIDRVLGSGAFASVWLAHDEVLDAQVAVKVLAGGLIDDLDVRNRFLEEAKILRRADSERLVRVHDIGELDDERPYFVMSYADLGTLADRMKNREVPVAEALRLAVEVAHGVEVINRLGVIHRDLKPSNVLFQSTTDGGERLLIADLGLAKALAHASGAFTLPVGTPGYMSPEQARFGGGLDVRADVYGLGALTYHLVTGRAPGTAPVLVPPSGLRPGLPPAVDEVVMRALEPDRERRWPTAEAFAAAVGVPLASAQDETDQTVRDYRSSGTETGHDSGAGGGSPTDSTMRVPPPPFEPHDETNEHPPAADGDTSTTLVDFRIDQPREPREHRPADSHGQPGPAQEPQPDRPGRKRLLVVAGLAAVLAVGGGGAYAVGKLTRSSPPRPEDKFVTVTDTTGRLSIRVPPAWKLQPERNTWPISVTDRAHAPALRATPDYAQFVRDDVAVPGVFAGVTHDLDVKLPPATLGRHRSKCTEGATRPYRHGSLSGQITPWTCGPITISEVGLRHSSGQFALWVRVKLTGPPDVTQQILDSIRTKG
jgi:serine/threonine protein kinase